MDVDLLDKFINVPGFAASAVVILVLLQRGVLRLGREVQAIELSRDRAWKEVTRLRSKLDNVEDVLRDDFQAMLADVREKN